MATMVGETCVALVWDSDIGMDYNNRRTANLQGARLGLFTFEVLDVVKPQATVPGFAGSPIPASTDSTSFFDVIIEVLPPETPDPAGFPVNDVLLPDTVQITSFEFTNGLLTVRAETDNRNAQLYIAIEGPDGSAPLITAESLTMMDAQGSSGKFFFDIAVNVSQMQNKVVTVYSDGGGNPLAPEAFGSGGTYNARIP